MFYTVTFNPSLDYIVRMKRFVVGGINRVSYEQVLGGGKGINVSVVLKNLGHDNTAMGFVAGLTGQEIIRQLDEFGCQHDFIQLPDGFTRINVKIKADKESEINGQGPVISAEAQAELFAKLDKLVAGDTLVLAGSIPESLPDDMYQRIMEQLSDRDIKIVVDATKKLLRKSLPYRPFLIKPNTYELGELFEKKLSSKKEIIEYAKKAQDLGARNVIVSMGADGALMLTEDGQLYECPAPQGKLVNSVGSGDSMVAGFLAGLEETGSAKEAFFMAVATGSASAFSENLATRPEMEALLKTIK